jgi:Histidine kinase-, DNA gyrase B-, and HSP90-like ATPase
LRETARGIHPAILAKGGLRTALKTLARRSPIPVDLRIAATGRLPEPVEVGAYYVAAEALTNVARHARASSVSVDVEVAGEVLRVAVRDDGCGGAGFSGGTGLVGLKDRVEAIGGRIFLDSPRGAGTTLRVELPITAANGDVTILDVRLTANTGSMNVTPATRPAYPSPCGSVPPIRTEPAIGCSAHARSGGKVIVGDPGGSVLAPPRPRLTTTMAPFRPFLSPASGQLELPPASMANGRWR